MMKKLSVFLTLLTLASAWAQDPDFSDILNYYQSEKQFNGVVLVATNGAIDYLDGVGLGNRQNGTVLKPKSKFQIASMTKVFTAVLVMKLAEKGKVNLQSTLGEYLPEYRGEGKDRVTIHQLLTYSSGIANALDTLGMAPYQKWESLDAFINHYCSGNLVYPPGERSEYGNTEYILLHKIIERVSGTSYEHYLQQQILDPLGLENTGMTKFDAITSDLLPGYTYNDSLNLFHREAPYYPEMYFGSGALYATVEDLLRFDQALFGYKLLSKESTDRMLTVYPELGYTTYGLWGSSGWGNFSEPFYYRTGGILGSNANWIHTMETGKTILVLSNTNATNLYQLSETLYLHSIGKPIDIPKIDLPKIQEGNTP